MTDAKHRKFFPDPKSKSRSNQEERRTVLLVTHTSTLGLALKHAELSRPALPPCSPNPEHQLQPLWKKEGPKQLPWAFPAFSYCRGDQCIEIRHLLSFLQTPITLHGAQLKATGPGGPVLEEELVLVKELK